MERSLGGRAGRRRSGSIARAGNGRFEIDEQGAFGGVGDAVLGGDFDGESLGDAVSYAEINGFFIDDAAGRVKS